MNEMRLSRIVQRLVKSCILAFFALISSPALAGIEETFDTLQIGTHTYKNVTVTTKAKDYVFVLYDGGMGNIKVSDLPRAAQQKLGYLPPDPKPNSTDTASNPGDATDLAAVAAGPPPKFDLRKPQPWLKYKWARLRNGQAKPVVEALTQKAEALAPTLNKLGPSSLYPALGAVAFAYLFYCYCAMLICQKAQTQPGIFIWLPVLQLFPLLKAARMSGWWFLAFFIPIINIIAGIIWSVEIAKARGKSGMVGFLLLLPVLNVFAFMFLAFSGAPKKEKKAPRAHPKEMLVLEAA